MSTIATRDAGSRTPAAEQPLRAILKEISVPEPVLAEASKRRNLVLEIAMEHDAARALFVSGSVAYGTANDPLEDADGGIKVNRRFDAFRAYGPDGADRGPDGFINLFVTFVLPRLRQRGYPNATVDLTGKRTIKFLFHEPVGVDELTGTIDPYVDFIVGLSRADGDGLWIPNTERGGWDPGDPERHRYLMNDRDEKPLRVLRAHVIRLAKRPVKRDAAQGRTAVMCSWNLSVLALESVRDPDQPLVEALGDLFHHAAASILVGLTNDPSPVITEPIRLPDGVSPQQASERLMEMGNIVDDAIAARSPQQARRELERLYSPEVTAIRNKEIAAYGLERSRGNVSGAAHAVGLAPALLSTRSHGDR